MESRRLENAAVKFSGMCCTMATPGQSLGRASRNTRRASVPPVEAPTRTTFSVVPNMALPVGPGRTASAESLGCTWICGAGMRMRILALAAPLTASQMRMRDSSRNCLAPSLGLVMMSTAPYSRARSMVSDPASVRVEQIMTGRGCWAMIFLRKVNPSMRGISMSSVMTSGTSSAMWDAA